MDEVEDGWGAVEPAEGAGATWPYFKLHKLCDATTTLRDSTWDPLRRAPSWDTSNVAARTQPGEEPTMEWRQRLTEWGNKVLANGRRGSELVAVQATLTSLPLDDLPAYLTEQVPELFKTFPDGSLWFLETDRLLPARMSVLRILLNQELVPDLFDVAVESGELVALEMLQEHSLTSGAAFASLVDPLLLVLPPTTLGYVFDWTPHGLVMCAGFAGLLIEDHPPTFASLFAPRGQSGYGFHWRETEIWDDVTPTTAEALLQWWVTRLNTIYSHACDPTCFVDNLGRFQPTRQAAWLLTFERLLTDALLIRSNPQGAAQTLHQAAFDLLDKAEVLLGFGSDDSGKGFQRLLRRSEMVDLLNSKWDARLPLQLRARFKLYTEHLYDRLHAEIRDEAYSVRLTARGVLVWNEKEARLIERQMDDYAPKLVRAIRNSAHGLVEQLESPVRQKERHLIATHKGTLPVVLPDLAALIAFALVADAERLCDGTWLTRDAT